MADIVHLVQKGSYTMAYKGRNQRPYAVGFRNASVARSVMWRVDPTERLTLLRGDSPVSLVEVDSKVKLDIDNEAVLYIPKGRTREASNDWTLVPVKYEDFVILPVIRNIGIIMPYVLITEDDVEFVFRSHVIEAP